MLHVQGTRNSKFRGIALNQHLLKEKFKCEDMWTALLMFQAGEFFAYG